MDGEIRHEEIFLAFKREMQEGKNEERVVQNGVSLVKGRKWDARVNRVFLSVWGIELNRGVILLSLSTAPRCRWRPPQITLPQP